MASKRIALSLRRAASSISSTSQCQRIARSHHTSPLPRWTAPSRVLRAQQRTATVAPAQRRWISDDNELKPSKLWDFAKVKELSTSPSPSKILLVDVREPHEYAAGYIPGAINIPVQSAPDALFLNEEEFEDRFGMKKPHRETEMVFYCKAGVRSRAAAQLAARNGYVKVGEYPGSWMDWVQKGGDVEGGSS